MWVTYKEQYVDGRDRPEPVGSIEREAQVRPSGRVDIEYIISSR